MTRALMEMIGTPDVPLLVIIGFLSWWAFWFMAAVAALCAVTYALLRLTRPIFRTVHLALKRFQENDESEEDHDLH